MKERQLKVWRRLSDIPEGALVECTKCKQQKPVRGFSRIREEFINSWCKACKADAVRAWVKMRRSQPGWKENRNKQARLQRMAWYGLSEDDYEAILAIQGGVCAACGREPTVRSLDIDHEHQPGDKKLAPWERLPRVRGLLCHLCNRALGLLKDNADTIRRLLAYVEGPPAAPMIKQRFENLVAYLERYEVSKEPPF